MACGGAVSATVITARAHEARQQRGVDGALRSNARSKPPTLWCETLGPGRTLFVQGTHNDKRLTLRNTMMLTRVILTGNYPINYKDWYHGGNSTYNGISINYSGKHGYS